MLAFMMKKRPSISQIWARAEHMPFGKRAFSKLLGRMAPYTGSVGAEVIELADGYAKVRIRDRRAVRNHLDCVHAIALMNLGEVATGLAMMHAIDGRGRAIITNLSMDYLKKARGTITATCNAGVPASTGTHTYIATADLVDDSGAVVARAHATWKVDIRD